MATTKRKTSKSRQKKGKKTSIKDFFHNFLRDDDGQGRTLLQRLPFVIGIIVAVFAIYMLAACLSYINTADSDQALLELLSQGNEAVNRRAANVTGRGGAQLANAIINNGFGWTALCIPIFLLIVGFKLMGVVDKARLWNKFLHLGFIMVWGSAAIAFCLPHTVREQLAYSPAGAHGDYICATATEQIGTIGFVGVLLALIIIYLAYLTQKTITLIQDGLRGVGRIGLLLSRLKGTTNASTPATATEPAPVEPAPQPTPQETAHNDNPNIVNFNNDNPNQSKRPTPPAHDEIPGITQLAAEEARADGQTLANYDPRLDLEYYKFPTLDLLQTYTAEQAIDPTEQSANKDRIKSVLHSFGVEISKIDATVGPTITLYEITLAEGIRVSKVRGLADDIALSLSALGIRIIAPIPGKGTIGIEVPNKRPQLVPIESVLNSKKFSETKYELPLALGKTITNEVFMVDLAKLPHLLVAGATGQGKSVGLNTIISSLLYKKHPSELKLVLIDPKKVEFSIYAPLEEHFLAKYPEDSDAIVTDVTKVVRVLRSLCQEMEDRYDLLGKANCRNIKEYNRLFVSRQLNPQNGHRFLPYFVIIIDEYGDLIMTAGKDIELPIARIAQKARAVGMHMVIATQRPTANIITGTIKANFPARMAFRVASQVDSRTILDQSGANQLIGKGDMLILASEMLPNRVQCAFIDTKEVINVTQFISEQQGYGHAYNLPLVADGDSPITSGNNSPDGSDDEVDPLFEEAARFVITKRSGSTSSLQRRFSIGYNRSGRLMDQLESFGVVGPAQGSKPRDILMTERELDIRLGNTHIKYDPQELPGGAPLGDDFSEG